MTLIRQVYYYPEKGFKGSFVAVPRVLAALEPLG